jgi:hypothetical protein
LVVNEPQGDMNVGHGLLTSPAQLSAMGRQRTLRCPGVTQTDN